MPLIGLYLFHPNIYKIKKFPFMINPEDLQLQSDNPTVE